MTVDQNTQNGGEEERVNYQELRDWIAHQEAYEASTSKPAPLTSAQRKALTLLKLPAAVPHEIEMGDKDWVSLLHRYRDAHHHIGVSITFSESPSPDLHWLCTCTLTTSSANFPDPAPFPGPDTGFLAATGAAPFFACKRDAKQYAARCCAEWLMAQGRIPPDGESVVFPRPTATTTLASSSSPSSAASPAPSPRQRKGIPGGAAVDVRDDDVPATQRVQEMCRRLGLQAPRYELRPAAAAGGGVGGPLWSGEPSFAGAAGPHLVPEGVGRVEGVYGKKFAKERIAEEVLAHLLQIEAQRSAQRGKLLDGVI